MLCVLSIWRLNQDDELIAGALAKVVVFGSLAVPHGAACLVINKPLQMLVGTPMNPKIYSMHFLSIFPQSLDGPFYYGAFHFETIDAFDGSFISDLDSKPGGRVEYTDKIPPLEKHVFTLAVAAPSQRIPVQKGRISAIEKLKSPPSRPGQRVALFSPDIILVASFDKEDRRLYFETSSTWHSFTPDRALLFALMQLSG